MAFIKYIHGLKVQLREEKQAASQASPEQRDQIVDYQEEGKSRVSFKDDKDTLESINLALHADHILDIFPVSVCAAVSHE